MNHGHSQIDVKNIHFYFRRYSFVEEVIHFGSRALGNYKSSSDVDLCLEGKSLTAKEVTELFGLLNDELSTPYKFDLVLQSSDLSPELKEHILKCGVVFYLKS
jgi:predicted nucleotidyltransferase